jgi:hypothetical protein
MTAREKGKSNSKSIKDIASMECYPILGKYY